MTAILTERCGSPIGVGRGVVHRLDELPGFMALDEGHAIVGIVTYRPAPRRWEVVSLDSLRPGLGIGSALLEAVAARARSAGTEPSALSRPGNRESRGTRTPDGVLIPLDFGHTVVLGVGRPTSLAPACSWLVLGLSASPIRAQFGPGRRLPRGQWSPRRSEWRP